MGEALKMPNVLQTLYEFGVREGLFEIKLIKELPATACTSLELEVIDFDVAKEKVSQRLGWPEQPKSCDALKFYWEAENLVFIEMKSFQSFKLWQLSRKQRTEHEITIESQIEKYNIPKKIADSLLVINQILQWCSLSDIEKTRVRSIVLTDIPLLADRSAEDFLDFTILYLAEGSISEDVLIQAKLLQAIETSFTVEEKPLLMSCDELALFFNNN